MEEQIKYELMNDFVNDFKPHIIIFKESMAFCDFYFLKLRQYNFVLLRYN